MCVQKCLSTAQSEVQMWKRPNSLLYTKKIEFLYPPGSVKHKQQPSSSVAQSRELITNSVSVDEVENHNGARFGAVELRALTEFERETGGYQSEHEEEEDEVFVGSRSMIEMQDTEALLKGKGSGRKKRKQPHTNMDM